MGQIGMFALTRNSRPVTPSAKVDLADRVSEGELSARFSEHPSRKPPTRDSERKVPH